RGEGGPRRRDSHRPGSHADRPPGLARAFPWAAHTRIGTRADVDRARLRCYPVRFRRLHDVRLLLDTHAFLWWVEGSPELGKRARTAIANPENEVLFSVASGWELAIKLSLGKLRLDQNLGRFIPEQLRLNAFTLLD